jgi:hypothetical protein
MGTAAMPSLTVVSLLIGVIAVLVLYAFFYAIGRVDDLSDEDHDEPLP